MSLHQSFTGASRKPRQVNLSGRRNTNPFSTTPSTSSQGGALAAAQQARQRREQERATANAAGVVQRYWRGYHARLTCHREWRQAFDAAEQQQQQQQQPPLHDAALAAAPPYASEPEALVQLRRLVRFASVADASDQQRVLRLWQRLSASRLSLADLAAASSAWRTPLSQLQRLIIGINNAAAAGSPQDAYIHALAAIIAQLPDLSTKNARLLYSYLRHMLTAYGPSLRESPDMREQLLKMTLQPLNSKLPHGQQAAYEAFAYKLLTLQQLQDYQATGGFLWALAPAVSSRALAHSLVSSIRSHDHHGYTELANFSGRSSLLGFLIFLHNQSQTLADDEYLFVVTELLSSVSADAGQISLNDFVLEQVLSMINSQSLSSFVSSKSSISRQGSTVFGDEAKHLATFALTLLRYFPQKSDEIRIKLYMTLTGAADGSEERLPALKFFWKATQSSPLLRMISNDVEKAIPLLNLDLGRLPDSPGYSSAACQDDWRVLLLLLELYSFALKIMDDEEFFSAASIAKSGEKPSWAKRNSLPLNDVNQLIYFLKNLGYALYLYGSRISAAAAPSQPRDSGSLSHYFRFSSTPQPAQSQADPEPLVARMPGITVAYTKGLVTGVLRMLYERDSRRPFVPKDGWLMLSHFDMDNFISAVVEEEERRRQVQEQDGESGDDEDDHDDDYDHDDDDEDDEGGMVGLTGQAARVRQITRLRRQQRKQARSRQLELVGPRLAVLQNMPFFIPFETRVEIFREFIRLDQIKRRGIVDPELWRMNLMLDQPQEASRHQARISRNQVFEDAYEQFMPLGEGLKEPIQIVFVDSFGSEEAGIDGGGVTKEFLTSVVQEAFTPTDKLNMFVENQSHLLYPNPSALDEVKYHLVHSSGWREGSPEYRQGVIDLLSRYEFMGRIIGKCLYEGILVDVSFAGFFLLKWALTGGDGHAARESSYRANLNDLCEMDEELYQGLLRLKNYAGDVSDMSLDFTIDDVITRNYKTGEQKHITRDLKQKGADMPVTNDNRLTYITYVARHRLAQQPYAQTNAFLAGLSTMIKPAWLNMFNQSELQTLVSGTRQAIDVQDLRANTLYGGLYVIGDDGLEHPTVQMFWSVMEELDDSERRAVLKFVTSTPRAPLLGFGSLHPQFSIRDSSSDQTRLPSTSTCVNLLKLPLYQDRALLKHKLLTAAFSGAGFDLS